jgi:translation initiation factor IF-2
MTQNDDKKTLTLKPTIGLKKPTPTTVPSSLSAGGGKNVAVFKKRRVFSGQSGSSMQLQSSGDGETTQVGGLTNNEFTSRINALKKAAHEPERRIFAPRHEVSLNELKDTPLNVGLEEIAQEPIIEAIVDHDIEANQVKHIEQKLKDKAKFDEIYPEEIEDEAKKVNKSEIKAKPKVPEERRAHNKIAAYQITDEDDVEHQINRGSYRRKDKKKKQFKVDTEKYAREVIIPGSMTVAELSNRMSEKSSTVIKELMKLGMMITANQEIDADTAELVVEALGHTFKRISGGDIEKVLAFQDKESDLSKRPPVVTIMGHVDHGKTSLLDALRLTDVASGEAGGITQHIGAYQVRLHSGDKITFIDTPGHEAFTAMRSRGAKATDIVVLVVAADDGIKAQTEEAINHAKAAEVPIIVAINKIDKPEADSARVKNELLNYNLVPEEFGGDVMVVEVSAKNKTNLDKLEETILLVAEMLELKANKDADASGIVIEAKVDKLKGSVATFLVQRGTLKIGDIVVAGTTYGKVTVIGDERNNKRDLAEPSSPVEVLGLESAPSAGDTFHVVSSEKLARDICEYRKGTVKAANVIRHNKDSLTELFANAGEITKLKHVNAIIKGDVQGSVEAIIGSVTKLSTSEVSVKILHSGVGGISESDVALAGASGAVIAGFNVRANAQAIELAAKEDVDIRYYSIIYNLVDDFKAMLSGMLSPIIREVYIGTVQIRQVFNITKVGKVAGSMVTKGVVKRGAGVRLLRDNVVIHEGKLKTLKRFKDEVKEVKEGYECGLAFEHYEDMRENDVVEVFEFVEEQRQL